ncbi:MAG: LysR family transcriptional regulator [Cognatishimia sp.]
MKPQHIQTLVAIAEAGSIRRAAEMMGKSQPAITKALRQIEIDVGAALFRRSSRGVALTDLGKRVLARARTIANEIDRMDQEIHQLRGEMVGQVHVSLSPYAAMEIFPQALRQFRRTYPNVQVRVSGGLFVDAQSQLREGEVDMLIGPEPAATAQDIVVERLIDAPTGLITSINSPFAAATSVRDLVDAPWIMIGMPMGGEIAFHQPFQQIGVTPPEATTVSESIFGTLSLVENLGAVSMFPLRLLGLGKRGWKITQINVRETIDSNYIALMTKGGVPLVPATEHLALQIRRRAEQVKRQYNQK